MDAAERMKAFWPSCCYGKGDWGADNYTHFPLLEEVLRQDENESNNAFPASIQAEFCRHLDTLQNSFKDYFDSGGLKVEMWVCNLFLANIDCISYEDLAKDDLRAKEMWNEFSSESWRILVCSDQKLPLCGKEGYESSDSFYDLWESIFSVLVSVKMKILKSIECQRRNSCHLIKDHSRVSYSY